QRNHAAGLAAHDWILAIDADERVTPELAREITGLLRGTPAAAGYRIPRVTRYLDRWVRSTDWYPDWQLRLYDRTRAAWNTRPVHESVEVRGPVARLCGELQHHAYRDLSHHLDTINRYTTLAAGHLFGQGRRSGPLRATLHATAAFLRNYLLRRGITDGSTGLVVSTMNAYYVWLKFVKLWALQHGAPLPPAAGAGHPAPPPDAGAP
ncbi:MAG: glycosyltransferase family 2 protein, partial [Vicinamibacterales bacterium]|nr:glycosyltransferase family 2 protein [Vicinamibacterales bacterium]